MAKASCEQCGATFDTGGDRYEKRPARYCGKDCQERAWRRINRPPTSPRLAARATAEWKLQVRHSSEFRRLLADELADRGIAS